jgi:hypothetical protein
MITQEKENFKQKKFFFILKGIETKAERKLIMMKLLLSK